MNSKLETIHIEDWVVKVQVPERIEKTPVVLLLHGWTGDENSMWVFTGKMNSRALFIAPRGLYPSGHAARSGYSWVADTATKWAAAPAFETSIERLSGLLGTLTNQYPADFDHLNLVGFSQGAALSCAFTLAHPERVTRLAMLSGFLPENIDLGKSDLAEKDVFIGHGSQDEIVPPERAEQADLFFKSAGAQVRFCLTDVGHKLGADCFRAFNSFFSDL
jgi:phospholipase/carboxylesterase